MWTVIGYGAIALAIMLVVAAFPVGLMMCAFAADSGKKSTGVFIGVLLVVLIAIAVEAGMLAWWGWSVI